MVALQKMSSSDTENTRRKDPPDLDTPPATAMKESSSSGSKDSGVDLASPVLRAAHAQEAGAGASFSDLAASEQADSEAPRPRPAHHRYPHAEEKISLLTFEEIKTRYFQIQLEDEGLLVDKIIPGMADCCSRAVAEVLGKLYMYRIYVYISYFLYFVFPNHATSKYCCDVRPGEGPPGATVRPPGQHPPLPSEQPPQTSLRPPAEAAAGGRPQPGAGAPLQPPLQPQLHAGRRPLALLPPARTLEIRGHQQPGPEAARGLISVQSVDI